MIVYRDIANLNINRARVAVLDAEIPKLENLAKKLENDAFIATGRYGDATGSIHATGGHSDPTQRQALEDMPDDVRQLYEDIRAMTIEKHRTAARIAIAEQALGFLNERERLVVECRCTENQSLAETVDTLYERTGKLITERTAWNIYNRACQKIAPFFTSDSAAATA